MPRELSKVWCFFENFFPNDQVKKTGVCRVCKAVVGLSKSSSNAQAHLDKHLSDEFDGKMEEIENELKSKDKV